MQFRLTIGKQLFSNAVAGKLWRASAGLTGQYGGTVNGMAITYDDISMAEDELFGLVGQLPERQRFETLVGYMVDPHFGGGSGA